MSTFSEKLRILRKNKEWTQAQLADALSVSESTVQKWEVDKNAPPVSEIKRLAEVFYLPARYPRIHLSRIHTCGGFLSEKCCTGLHPT